MSNHTGYQVSNPIRFRDLPSNWKVKRFKYLTQSRKELSETGDEELLSVTEVRGIVKRRELKSNDESLSRAEDLTGYRHVKKGDLVSNIMLVWKRGLGVSPYNGIVSPAYSVFTFSDECYSEYYNYLVRSDEYITEFRKHSTGITMSRLRLYDDSFGAVFAHVPPIEEQKLISHYLDKKCLQIDCMVEKIQKKIELLKKKRTSIINQCITGGLDSNVKMKDSGIKWVGKIPIHWISTKIRFITEDHRQGFYTSDPYDDEGIPILRITDIKDDHSFSYLDSPKYSRSENEIKNFYVKDGDFLFPRTGGVGRFGIVDFDFPCIYGSFMIRFRFNSLINKQFMKFFLESSVFIDQVKQEIHGGVNQNVHVDNIKNVILFLPSIDEQIHISDYILKNTQNIDKNIKLEKRRINLLKEYRLSLISSVVTGKVRIIKDMV